MKKSAGNAGQGGIPFECCRVESVVTVDARGQLVLPKELRDRAGIGAGDKLAILSWDKNGSTCCIALIKAEGLSGMVKGFLGPLLGAGAGK